LYLLFWPKRITKTAGVNEDHIINNISCNFSDHAAVINYNLNPVEKILELVEENKKSYAELLKEKSEQIELLKKMLEKK
jgi:hypothetical protein